MESQFSKLYPNIAHWVNTQGQIEIGPDEYSSSLVRALDEGGLIWESSDDHTTVDEALQALEDNGTNISRCIALRGALFSQRGDFSPCASS